MGEREWRGGGAVLQCLAVGGHTAGAPSSRCATAPLGCARFAVTARQRRGLLPPCLFGERSAPGGARVTKETCRPTGRRRARQSRLASSCERPAKRAWPLRPRPALAARRLLNLSGCSERLLHHAALGAPERQRRGGGERLLHLFGAERLLFAACELVGGARKAPRASPRNRRARGSPAPRRPASRRANVSSCGWQSQIAPRGPIRTMRVCAAPSSKITRNSPTRSLLPGTPVKALTLHDPVSA